MRKKICFIAAAITICTAIMVNSFAAAAQVTPIQPQNIQNEAQLTRYIESVRQSNEDRYSSLDSDASVTATITFSKYISFEELQDYISEFDIKLQQIQLRGLTADGTRVTIATLTHKGMSYTEQLMYEQAADQGFELVGITDIYAYVLPHKIESISENELTYLVELAAVDDMDAYSLGREKAGDESGESKAAFPKSITWELEDLDLL